VESGTLCDFSDSFKNFSIASEDDQNVSRRPAGITFTKRAIHRSFEPLKDRPMAFTPSKDQKRREREQKKLDKRMAREDEKAEKLAARQAAAEDTSEMTEEEIQAKIEADFEAELAAEEAEGKPEIAC
jgi:hypothetical protein